MGTEFKWQTENEEWDQEPAAEKPAAGRPLWPWLVGILLLLVAVTFIYHQRHQSITAPILPPPDQLIELRCRTGRSGTAANYWYDPRQQQWLDGPQLPEDRNVSRITALDENSFLIEETSYDQDGPHWQLSLWEDNTLL